MDNNTAVIIAVIVPVALVVLVAVIVCLIRQLMDRSKMGSVVYDRISHELDDEEMEFKRSIEMRNASSTVYGNVEYDEDDELYGFDMDDDMDFGEKDMERLNMLDKFRSNLVAGADVVMGKNGADDDIDSRTPMHMTEDRSGEEYEGDRENNPFSSSHEDTREDRESELPGLRV